jgi:hypothetical protein
MQFAPGTRWRYNNSGYILLGAIIETVTGKKYADVVRERIFQPLAMADTRYDDTEAVIPRRAAGYAQTRNGLINAQYLSMTQPYAAGALMSTVDDLAKWEAGLAAGKVVKAAALDRLFANYPLASGAASGYGYGWQIGAHEGRPVQEHGGGIPGFRAHVLRMPSDGVYVAVLSNVAAPEPDPQMLARKAAAIAIGKPLTDPAVITLTEEQLDAYVGQYVAVGGTRRTVTREGTRLFMATGGGPRTEILPSGQDTFFAKDRFMRLLFERDAPGKAVRLRITDWGEEPVATRDDKPAKPAPVQVAVDPALYDAYVGEYELAPGFILTVTREGNSLMTQATGQGKVEVFPSAATEFFLKVVDAQLSIVKDVSGTVTGIVLHQGGRDVPGKKIK